MTLFFIIAAMLVGICLLWLLLGLFRHGRNSIDQEAVNISLARERRATLDAAFKDGSIDEASYAYEREQLEYDLAADLRSEEGRRKPRSSGQLTAAVLVSLFVPLAAGTLYLQLGNPAAINQQRASNPGATAGSSAAGQAGEQAPALSDLLPRLEERLASAPDDIDGWRLLGRSYLSISEFARAKVAFEKALALDENDVSTLAQLAESIAMVQGGELAGQPLAYLERAIALNPMDEQTLWLLAIARQQSGDHAAALQRFDTLQEMSQGRPEALAAIKQMRSQSVEALSRDGQVSSEAGASSSDPAVTEADPDAGVGAGSGTDAEAESSSDPVSDTQPSDTEASDTPAVSIKVEVSLSDEARSKVDGGNAVFIYARATSGPPMPLAVSRLTVGELPVVVTLDDSMAMIPTMKLSAFPEVTIGARISPSGNPIAQSGDWFAEQSNITVSDTDSLSLTIESQQP